jgi:PIN like domain
MAKEAVRSDNFVLEEIYPDAGQLFASYKSPAATDKSAIVVLDTNALLLPYEIGSARLKELASVYDRLATERRLFVPARVLREFIQRRDRHLANMIKALTDRKRGLVSNQMHLVLEGVPGYSDASNAYQKMSAARFEYVDAIDKIIAVVKAWRGYDPVSKIYGRLFGKDSIVDPPSDEVSLGEMEWRYRHALPPGYKDAKKEDGGVGDFIIWKSLLALGKIEKKDLIFVTGEQKGDWFVRSDNLPIYPRFELIYEYRSASEGKSLRLTSLHELLQEMNAPREVVADIKVAEFTTNSALSSGGSTVVGSPFGYSEWPAVIRNILGSARQELFIVDPFVHERMFEIMDGWVSDGVAIRILTSQRGVSPEFAESASRWIERSGAIRSLVIRMFPGGGLHERVVGVDRTSVWVLSQSMVPSTTEKVASAIPLGKEASALTLATYDALWSEAAPIDTSTAAAITKSDT